MNDEITEALARTVLLARDFVPSDVSDDAIIQGLRATGAVLYADAANLASGACVSGVVTLAQQLVATGIGVRYTGPDAALACAQPPWASRTLYGVLGEMAADFMPGARVDIGGDARADELPFAFGDTPAGGDRGWRLSGGAWDGVTSPLRSPAPRWRGDFPLGALAAATIAAAEPFKVALLTLFSPDDVQTAQLQPAGGARVRFASDATPLPADLGHVDCISGGAIMQSALHALLRVPGLRADFRMYEPQLLELSNVNRYALARRRFVGRPKLEGIYACASPGFRIRGEQVLFDAAVAATTVLAPSVLVGTDDIPSRSLVQSRATGWLGVGATSHFEAMATEHESALKSGCAGCAHPTTDGVVATIPTIAFVSYWGGLMLAARLLRRLGGVHCELGEQAVSLFTLRLDGRHGQWRRPVPVVAECPLSNHATAA